jgi:hypothetical protein
LQRRELDAGGGRRGCDGRGRTEEGDVIGVHFERYVSRFGGLTCGTWGKGVGQGLVRVGAAGLGTAVPSGSGEMTRGSGRSWRVKRTFEGWIRFVRGECWRLLAMRASVTSRGARR